MVNEEKINTLILSCLSDGNPHSSHEIKKYVSFREELNYVDKSFYPGTNLPRWELLFQQAMDSLVFGGKINNLWRDMFAVAK